jgi:hypothetical protein
LCTGGEKVPGKSDISGVIEAGNLRRYEFAGFERGAGLGLSRRVTRALKHARPVVVYRGEPQREHMRMTRDFAAKEKAG